VTDCLKQVYLGKEKRGAHENAQHVKSKAYEDNGVSDLKLKRRASRKEGLGARRIGITSSLARLIWPSLGSAGSAAIMFSFLVNIIIKVGTRWPKVSKKRAGTKSWSKLYAIS